MKKKRILSAIVALATALCGVTFVGRTGAVPEMSFVAGAEELPSGGISVSQTKVQKGGAFDVSINVPASNVFADTIELRLEFDPGVFEIVTWNPSLYGAEKYFDNSVGYATLAYASGSSNVDLRNGLSYTAKMRLKAEDPTGNYLIRMTRYIVNSFDYGYRWVPETTSVKVKLANAVTVMTGKVSSFGVGGTATVSLTDSSGSTVTAEAVLTEVSTNIYEGTYTFKDVEIGEKYTMKTALPGCVEREEEITPTNAWGETRDTSVNMRGDADSDGIITALDATVILRYLVGSDTTYINKGGKVDEYLISVANVTGTGTIDVRDATQILRKLAQISSVF